MLTSAALKTLIDISPSAKRKQPPRIADDVRAARRIGFLSGSFAGARLTVAAIYDSLISFSSRCNSIHNKFTNLIAVFLVNAFETSWNSVIRNSQKSGALMTPNTHLQACNRHRQIFVSCKWNNPCTSTSVCGCL